MVSPRKVVRVGGQLVIAIPADAKKALHASPGRALYWHPGHEGEAILAISHTRKRGKPPNPEKGAAIAALEAEVYRLNNRLERQRAALWNEWQNQALLKRMSIELKGLPVLDMILARLTDIQRRLPGGEAASRWPAPGRTGGGRVRRAGDGSPVMDAVYDELRELQKDVAPPRRRRRAAPPVPPASAPPPSEVVEGEAVAPGEPLPQGHP